MHIIKNIKVNINNLLKLVALLYILNAHNWECQGKFWGIVEVSCFVIHFILFIYFIKQTATIWPIYKHVEYQNYIYI